MSKLPVGVLLAAGQSRRFGSNKLLYKVRDDTPLVLVTAAKLARVLPNSIVVINHELETYVPQFEQHGFRVVVNQEADHGIGSSIACGIRASLEATGWLIALADMPYIKPETISLLISKLKDGAGIVAPVYDQQRGHPVGFNRQYRDELASLNDDIGARSIIAHHNDELVLLPTQDSGVIQDIDLLIDIK